MSETLKCFLSFFFQEHEKQVQLLVSQLTESTQEGGLSSGEEGERERVRLLESKVKLLEKDLFYYKKTSRELKKKLHGHEVGVATGRGRGREEGGRETASAKIKTGWSDVEQSGSVSAVFEEGVADSLDGEVEREKSLTVSGVAIPSAKSHARHSHSAVAISSSDVRGSGDQTPPTTGESQPVIRKQKKQLRQLRYLECHVTN